jgi:hypothetical protein
VSTFALDHPFVVMAGVSILAIVAMAFLQRRVHPTWVTVANGIVVTVLVSLPMTHLFNLSRDREQQRLALRSAHLERLRPALRVDYERLGAVATNVGVQGRFTDVGQDTAANETELQKQFYPDPLSPDLANHFAEYSAQKERLRTEVREQDREDREARSRVVKMLPPHPHRDNLALAILGNCRGLGGMTLRELPGGGYGYSFVGPCCHATAGAGSAPPDIVEALKIYNAFRPTAEVSAICESLKTRAARIVASARKLSLEAQRLAERPTLPGGCEYVTLD